MSHHLFYPLSAFFDHLAAALSVPNDQGRLLTCLLVAVPLGLWHKSLRRASQKHILSLAAGLSFAYIVVGPPSLHVLLVSLLLYALSTHASVLQWKWSPHALTAALIAYLSAFHLYRLFWHYLAWEMDVTLIQMIFVVKASTFAFNVSDGYWLKRKAILHSKPHLHEHFSQRALADIPSCLEYMSYIWSFTGVLCGPCFECRDHLEFTEGVLFQRNGFSVAAPPNTLLPALSAMLSALLCYPFVLIHNSMPVMHFVDQPEYARMTWLRKFVYFWITITCSRFKYYFAWYMSEAGCNAEGFGLTCKDKNGSLIWSRCNNANALKVETATSFPAITNEWNTGVNNWLKYYVYFRVDPPRNITQFVSPKTVANLVTKMTSAFWHGFYPSYYLFFFGAFLASEMDEILRLQMLTQIPPNSSLVTVFRVFNWFLVFYFMNMLGMAFLLLEVTSSLKFWSVFFYSVFWLPLVVIILCKTLLPLPKQSCEQETKGNGAKNRNGKTPVNKDL